MPTKKSEPLFIPKIDTKLVKVSIKGDSPLLVNKKPQSVIDRMEEKHQLKGQRGRGVRDIHQEYLDSMYFLEDGITHGFPVAGIKKSLTDSCSFIEGITKVLSRGAFFIVGEYLEIKGSEPVMDRRPVRVGISGMDIRYRARFDEWEIDLPIRYNASVISIEGIVNLIENAGFSIGIGDYRPQKNGNYGTFHVDLDKGITEMRE